jgi:hypothetical protein
LSRGSCCIHVPCGRARNVGNEACTPRTSALLSGDSQQRCSFLGRHVHAQERAVSTRCCLSHYWSSRATVYPYVSELHCTTRIRNGICRKQLKRRRRFRVWRHERNAAQAIGAPARRGPRERKEAQEGHHRGRRCIYAGTLLLRRLHYCPVRLCAGAAVIMRWPEVTHPPSPGVPSSRRVRLRRRCGPRLCVLHPEPGTDVRAGAR